MRRWMGVLLGVGLLLLGWSAFRPAGASGAPCGQRAEQVTVLARGGTDRAYVALDDIGEIAFLDPETNETIIPLRPFFTILSNVGAVRWDESSRTARFSYDVHQLSLQVPQSGGQISTRLDDVPYSLRAYVCDGHLHAPLRAVANALGLELQWYAADQTALVTPVRTQLPAQEPVVAPGQTRPAACNRADQVGWSDFWSNPFSAWDRSLRRTACALII